MNKYDLVTGIVHGRGRVTYRDGSQDGWNGQGAPLYDHWCEGGPAVCWIPFSQYELANLAALLTAIFAWQYGLEALPGTQAFSTGDWAGTVPDKLRHAAEQFCAKHPPNESATEMLDRARRTR